MAIAMNPQAHHENHYEMENFANEIHLLVHVSTVLPAADFGGDTVPRPDVAVLEPGVNFADRAVRRGLDNLGVADVAGPAPAVTDDLQPMACMQPGVGPDRNLNQPAAAHPPARGRQQRAAICPGTSTSN